MFASFYVTAFEAFMASISAMFIEGFEIKIFNKRIDDNLIIPVVAGAVIWMIRLVF